jgi:hypothetical protein
MSSPIVHVPEAPSAGNGMTRDRCYDFENIFAKKFSENIGVF